MTGYEHYASALCCSPLFLLFASYSLLASTLFVTVVSNCDSTGLNFHPLSCLPHFIFPAVEYPSLSLVSTKQVPFTSFTLLFAPAIFSSSTMANNVPVNPDIDFDGVTLAANGQARVFTMGSYTETVTPAYREQLAGEELTKFHDKATTPLKTKYSLEWASLNPKTESDKDFFDHTNKLTQNTFSLRTQLQSFCMTSVFRIFPVDAQGLLDPNGHFISLLDHPTVISEWQIRMSNRIWAEGTTQRIHPQNIAWTQELLLPSCDSTMRSDIEARLMNIPDNEQGGPLIYHMILNSLVSSTSEANRGVIRKLETLSIADFAGENIHNFCASFNTEFASP
jgi:hypothetical protein